MANERLGPEGPSESDCAGPGRSWTLDEFISFQHQEEGYGSRGRGQANSDRRVGIWEKYQAWGKGTLDGSAWGGLEKGSPLPNLADTYHVPRVLQTSEGIQNIPLQKVFCFLCLF